MNHGTDISPRLMIVVVLALAVGLCVVIMLRSAWLADDAYITLRTVDNWVSGYGLRWNVAERVQSYTHPLWMFTVAGIYSVTHEIYYTLIFSSLAISLAAIGMLIALARSALIAIVAITLLTSSKAFIDYSTSGLENPLTHLLIGIFFWLYLRTWHSRAHRLFWLTFLVGLIAINRLDTAFLVLFPWAYALWSSRTLRWKKIFLITALGLLPLIAWEVFSLFYYGFLFPNTAYGKLFAGGVAKATLLGHGMYYVIDSLVRDPLTLITIAVITCLVFSARQWRLLPLLIGIYAYLFYIVNVGGDFMSGRFFSAPFFAAILIGTQFFLRVRAVALVVPLIIISSVPLTRQSPWRTLETYDIKDSGSYESNLGIADERAYYYQRTGFLSRQRTAPSVGWLKHAEEKRPTVIRVVERENGGMTAFNFGPHVHVIEQLGLSDPLIARLPRPKDGFWRTGHLERKIPLGYARTIQEKTNFICNPGLAQYYENLRLVTRGPLFDPQRLLTVVVMNLHLYDDWLEQYNPDTDRCFVPPLPV